MFLRLTLALIVSISLTACNQTVTAVCYDVQGDISFTGFDSSELEAVELKAFVGNGRFDSMLYSRVSTVYYGVYSVYDRAIMSSVVNSDTLDFEISMPAAGKTYRITDITREAQHSESFKMPFGSKVDVNCTNEFLTYSLNGETRQWKSSGNQYIEINK
jgi:hypothetical protein